MASEFDPSTVIPGFTITYGEVNLGGDCWNGMPAIYRIIERKFTLGPDDDRHPPTIELYEKYGATLPDEYEIEELADIEIGCENYQKLVSAGLALSACVECPLLQSK